MNVAIIGSGGREHALAYKISQSPQLSNLFILPGNPGTKQFGKNIEISASDNNQIAEFCLQNNIELVVIGPEQPLVDGLADDLRNKNISVFGPNSSAAQIEASKIFAKKLMKKYLIPTASFEAFDISEYEKAKNYLQKIIFPCVIKADGLAAGKGVLICNDIDEGLNALDEIFAKKAFGSAGSQIIIEEFMEGEEASIFAITDGEDYVILPSSQDHKRIGDNDTGKNTGGMGAYSPAPLITKEILEEIEHKIISPTITAMSSEGKKFIGCLYAGLMITPQGPKVVEFNCRFGDPETQAVLPLVKGDFLALLSSAALGKINKESVEYSGGASVCVVAASKGYPDTFEKGFEISGLESAQSSAFHIFQAGTTEVSGKILTAGGRVLAVVAVENKNDILTAKENAYKNLSKINFENIYYRKDIGDKGISI